MKHRRSNFFLVSHEPFGEDGERGEIDNLTPNARLLWFILNRLKNRYGDRRGEFYRTNADLARDTGLSLSTVKRVKEELSQKGWITVGYRRFPDWQPGKWSEKRVTEFILLK